MPLYSEHPNILGCPLHGTKKMWCRLHHNPFYDTCSMCETTIIRKMLVNIDHSMTAIHDELYILRSAADGPKPI